MTATQTTTRVENPVEFDEKLRVMHEQAWTTQNQLDSLRDKMHRAVGDRQEYIGKRQYWRRTAGEVLESLQIMAKHNADLPASVNSSGRVTAASLLQDENDLLNKLAGQLLEIRQMDDIYALPENRWNRYYRCLNSDGHIHRTLRGCSSVRHDTAMGWNTHLSGQPVEAAIADLGPTLCSLCFAGAPAEHCRKQSDVTREAREAAKAARLEAKYVKRLRPSEVFRCDGSWVETVAACKDILRQEVMFRNYLGHGKHPSWDAYRVAAEQAKAVLMARDADHGGMTETEIVTLVERAVTRNRKENERP